MQTLFLLNQTKKTARNEYLKDFEISAGRVFGKVELYLQTLYQFKVKLRNLHDNGNKMVRFHAKISLYICRMNGICGFHHNIVKFAMHKFKRRKCIRSAMHSLNLTNFLNLFNGQFSLAASSVFY